MYPICIDTAHGHSKRSKMSLGLLHFLSLSFIDWIWVWSSSPRIMQIVLKCILMDIFCATIQHLTIALNLMRALSGVAHYDLRLGWIFNCFFTNLLQCSIHRPQIRSFSICIVRVGLFLRYVFKTKERKIERTEGGICAAWASCINNRCSHFTVSLNY